MPYETIMPFGEFKGARIIEIPADRCEWLLTEWRGRNDLSPSLRKALQERVKINAEECAR